MMKNKVLISIIVPVYKVEKFLYRCVDSLLNQDFKDYEIILVDDGSPDNCPKICDEYAKKNKCIKVIHQNNSGLSEARNTGIAKSKGNFICFVDSDDYVEKNYLSVMYNEALEHGFDVVCCNYKRIYPDNEQVCFVDVFKCQNFINPSAWNKLYKKSIFNEIKFPAKKYYEDLGTFPKILINGAKIGFVDECLYNYFQNPESIMHTSNNRIFEIFDVLEDSVSYAKKKKKYEKYKTNFEMAYVFHVLIGATYRLSFHSDFSVKMISGVYEKVSKDYPKWYLNKGIINLNFLYQIFLLLFRLKLFFLIYILLKLFNKLITRYR